VIDTHAHLDACAEPTSLLVTRARAAGVDRIVTIGTGIESSRRALELAEQEDGVYAVLGVDPHRAATPDAARVRELETLLAHERVVAVGETGLDYHYGADAKREQQRLFAEHLGLAERFAKPVVIHCREAAADTADMLAGFGGTVILHCFSEPLLFAAADERGYYVSFAGNVTFPRSTELRELAGRVTTERILAETDSPYLAPQPLRGRPNEPANVVHTLAALAEVRGVEPAALGERIDENATRAFALGDA
jgi:TatD DNase family protein